jgi:hypothetical protein
MPFFDKPSPGADEIERIAKSLGIRPDSKKLRLAVAVDTESGKIIVDIGKAVSRFEMDKKLAEKFIATLQKKVNELICS